jgi:hypothetical protein
MDSSVYKEEIGALKFRQVDDSLVLSVAKSSYSDPRIRNLCSDSSIPLDETIRVLTECTPMGEIGTDKLAEAVEAISILESIVKQNPALVTYYTEQIKEERALPILGVEEIVMIIATAFLNGAFSEIAKSLLEKLLKGAPAQNKEIKKAMQLLLSNSLLPVLEADEDRQTTSQIARKLGMKPEEAMYFLAKYEERGWVKQVRKGQQVVWKLKKSRAAIIDELVP